MPTEFNRVPTDDGVTLSLKDVRLALSPHEAELRTEWEARNPGQTLGSNDTFFAIYLEGSTDTPDPADPDVESVRGYSVHVLRRDSDPTPFIFDVDRSGPKPVYTLILKKNTEVFFLRDRNLADSTKVFADPKPISQHATILAGLKDPAGPNSGGGTSTGQEAFGHPSPAKTIIQLSI